MSAISFDKEMERLGATVHKTIGARVIFSLPGEPYINVDGPSLEVSKRIALEAASLAQKRSTLESAAE